MAKINLSPSANQDNVFNNNQGDARQRANRKKQISQDNRLNEAFFDLQADNIVQSVFSTDAWNTFANSKENTVVRQTTEPTTKTLNMLWMDTSVVPNLLKRWDGSSWVNTSYDQASIQVLADSIASTVVKTAIKGQDSVLPYIQSEWESGVINGDGSETTNSAYLRTKNRHPILPNTDYVLQCSANLDPSNTIIFFYTSADAFISYLSFTGEEIKITTPATAAKFKVRMRKVDASEFLLTQMVDYSVRVTRNASLTTLQDYSTILQTASEISLEIGKIQVGATNFVKNSNFADGLTSWFASGVVTLDTTTGVYDSQCISMVGAFGTTKYLRQAPIYVVPTAVAGTQFTFSVYTKGENIVYGTTNPFVQLYVEMVFTDATVSSLATSVGSGTFDWKRISFVYTVPVGKTIDYFRVYGFARDFTGKVYYDNFKMEVGNKATDWSLHPSELFGAKYIFNGENATFKGGGLIIQNNAGGTVMTADTDGELWVQGYVKVGTTNVNAGLSGKGTLATDIRIWAGWATPSTSADFYVRDDGYLKADKGAIAGWLLSASQISKGNVKLDSLNERIYIGTAYFYTYGSGVMGVSGSLRVTSDLTVAGTQATVQALNVNSTLRVYSTGYHRLMYPEASNAYDIGSTTLRFRTIYSVNALNTGSDIRFKENVEVVGDEFDDMIFNTEIIAYNIVGQPNRTLGINANKFHETFGVKGEFIAKLGEDGYYGAEYGTFVPMLIKTVQQLNKRLLALERN